MPLDAVCLSALCGELGRRIIGMKIDKVQQPERDEILLNLRGNGDNCRLLISAGTGNARVHVTEFSYENPQTPPMFCMLLRKHLVGAKICGLTQPPMERMLDMELDTYDEMGVYCKKRLILEIMGRYSNIILVGPDGIIIDCLRRVDSEMSERRQVLPGLIYRLPPKQDKLNPAETGSLEAVFGLNPPAGQLDKWLLGNFEGLSPLICREIVSRAYGRTDIRAEECDDLRPLASEFERLMGSVKSGSFTPLLLSEQGKPADFSYTDITQYGDIYDKENMGGFSQLLEAYYTRRDKADRVRQRAQSMTKTVKNAAARIERKLNLQRQEYTATLDRDRLRQQGDIITANLYQMQKGMTVLKAADFYSEDGVEVEIRLDPRKTPQQNAAKYYRDYTKAKNAEKVLSEQILSGENELQYLNSVIEEIEKAEGERDLAEIRQELTDTGYLRRQKSGKKEKRVEQKPMHFRSESGYDIWVGKNNIQNDRLTLKTALKTDIWLHTQKIHGSHVIISCGGTTPDNGTVETAAMLAALYSQGRESRKVPVDYTAVKNVKKPSGGKPGMVIYVDYKTVFVTPDEKLAEKLRVK